MRRKDAASNVPSNTPIEEVSQLTLRAEDAADGAGVEAPVSKVGPGFIFTYGLTYFGFFLCLFMPALFSLPYKIQLIDPASKETALGLIVGISAVVLLPIGPILGVLSDRSKFSWGRRRPFLLLGLAAFAVSAFVIATAPTVPIVLLGYVVAQLGVALVSVALNPALAELVPQAQRGKLGALSGVMASIAGVFATLVGSLLIGNLLLLFLLPVGVLAVGVALWIVVVPDRPAPERFQSVRLATALRSLLFNPLKHLDFTWVWIGKLCIGVGTAFFSTYQLYYLLDRLGFTVEQAGQQLAVAGGLALLATVGFTILGGFLSDKLHRRKPFIYIASAMIASGMVLAAFAPDFGVYIIGAVLLSAGSGAFNSVDLALASEVLPDPEAGGKWLSIYQISGTIATAVGPVIAPLLLAIGGGSGNYTALFIVGGLFALGAAVTASRVRGVR
ncbi:MFS transporter [Rathayibacter sp. VKM Ac-2760]|uniref:MFS transporter n=1 Tax=Rathayibacter sp. VKM Ac-2760 TaxID=2609253 RepID=UPI0013174D26|nr:MFS transporter [Rathayibacter sp. VKM Ac-2760]QHC57827.1 MFS transporter [Rathayibacter sp. VKM Ac-2760]